MVHTDIFRRGTAHLTKTGLDAVYNREAPVILLVDRQNVAHIVVSVAVFLKAAVIELAVLQSLLRLVSFGRLFAGVKSEYFLMEQA